VLSEVALMMAGSVVRLSWMVSIIVGLPAGFCPFMDYLGWRTVLARIFQQVFAAAADAGMSTVLCFAGVLDVLSRTPAAPSVARC